MNKYKAKKVEADGYVFDSKKEYERYLVLKEMEKRAEIEFLEVHKEYIVIPKQFDENGKMIERPTKYFADFDYWQNGEHIVEDVKGFRRSNAYDLFVMKRKLMLQKYGLRVREI